MNYNSDPSSEIKIIDVHGHIGDILYPDGGKLIPKTGINFPTSFLEWFLCERVLYRETFFFRTAEKISPYWSVRQERKRNRAATLENFRKSLDGTNIVRCVCAPVAPNITYDDVLAAARHEARIIAFTSPDFTARNMPDKLRSDLNAGAMGVKIHPIIQQVETDSDSIMSAVDTVRAFSVPVLLHAGPARYYLPSEDRARSLDFSSIERIERLVASFPDVNFIIGHAGLDDYKKVLALIPKYKNAFVDTSFQHPQAIKDLIAAFGGERVLFASDWHYGLRKPAVAAVLEACGNDSELEKRVFYDNAADLLKI